MPPEWATAALNPYWWSLFQAAHFVHSSARHYDQGTPEGELRVTYGGHRCQEPSLPTSMLQLTVGHRRVTWTLMDRLQGSG